MQQHTYGVTSPLSTRFPYPKEIALSKKHREYVENQGVFESEQEKNQRKIVLAQLHGYVKSFVKTISEKRVSRDFFYL